MENLKKEERYLLKTKIFLRTLKNAQNHLFFIAYKNKIEKDFFSIADNIINSYNKKEDYSKLKNYEKLQFVDFLFRKKFVDLQNFNFEKNGIEGLNECLDKVIEKHEKK